MNLKNGKQWPIAIALGIFGVFGLSVWTVMFAMKSPVQDSDIYMNNYHIVDDNVNEIIRANIEFDKKYTLKYLTKQLDAKGTVVEYKITDKKNNPINNASVKLILTRPNIHTYDMTLEKPSVSNGIYSFEKVTLPKEGRWNIMANVVIGNDYKYYNLKADTRINEVFEY